jgi:AraC family transcriptional activator FtrA
LLFGKLAGCSPGLKLAYHSTIVDIMLNPMSVPTANSLVVALAYDGLCTFEFGVAVEIFALPRPELGPD